MRSDRLVSALSCLVLALAAAVAVAYAGQGTWDPALLVILLVLVIASDRLEVEWKGRALSGAGLGFVVAAAVLGPAQAAVIAAISSILWALSSPTRVPAALASLANFVVMAVAAGVIIDVLGGVLSASSTDPEFAVAVAIGFLVAHALNAALAIVFMRLLDDVPMGDHLRTVVVPLLPSEAAMALLSGVVVYAYAHLGVVALGMLAGMLLLYLWLLRELMVSQERGEELERRGEQLASLQVGVLTAMLRTLSMRDQMTARHSAAVARYTREIAKAAGFSLEEQDLAHTAGLLHDIGKFILPDHILLANTKLDEDDWQTIKMHPYQGSKVVREVEGYGPVADIIWCHHERVDGGGYPRGLSGEDIPLISRMISIADTYDVMTARDSYRDPVSSQAAIEELRRVSGKQLDGRLVEIFIGVLEDKGLAFRHADDADFEAELSFDRRVRDYAAPRGNALPVAA